jgi:hypothetical protein
MQTEVIDTRIEIHIKGTEAGYDFIMKPLYTKSTRDGQPVDNPVFGLLTKMRPVYHVDSAGQIVSIDGFNKLADLIAESVPPDMAPQMQAILSEETLVNGEITEWNGRIGDFVGAVVEAGDVFYSEAAVALPMGGSATYYSVIKIMETVQCGEKQCVRIGYSYNSDPEGLKQFMGDFFEEFAAAIDSSGVDVSVSGAEVTGEGERLVDPATMLIMSETVTRTIKMQVDVSGEEPVYGTVVEQREYKYEY